MPAKKPTNARTRKAGRGKVGIIDASGTFLLEPIYSAITQARDGRVFAERPKKRWHYLDVRTGDSRFAIDADAVSDFAGGLARVKRGSSFAFYTPTGDLAIADREGNARDFTDGLAMFRDANKRHGFLDTSGREVAPAIYDTAKPFTEGRAMVARDDRFGFIDATGRAVIELRFTDAWPFSDGLAPVCVGDHWGLIDRDGTMVIEPRFRTRPDVAHGLITGGVEDGHEVLTLTGELVARFPGGTLVWIHPSLLHVELEAWYAYDHRGERRAGPFRRMGAEHDGMTDVWTDDGYGYLDATGAFAVAPTLTNAWEFGCDRAVTRTKSQLAIIDRTGARVAKIRDKLERPFATRFVGNLAMLGNGEKYAIVTTRGELITAFTVSDAALLGDYVRVTY